VAPYSLDRAQPGQEQPGATCCSRTIPTRCRSSSPCVFLNRHPQTQAPTALAIAVAVAVLLLSEVRFGPRKRRAPALPAPAPPSPAEPVAVSFNLDLTVGTFRLRVAHQSASNRIAILGPSGAGKSINAARDRRVPRPAGGHVEFNGEEVAGIRVEDRRVGYVPQGLVMFPGRTAWQQVLFAAGADRPWPPGGCARCGLTALKAGCRGAVRRSAAAGRALRAPLSFRPGSCCSTSRSARSTPRSARTAPRAAPPAARGGPVHRPGDPRPRRGGPARR